MTKSEAIKELVKGFDSVEQTLIYNAVKNNIDDWTVLTPLCVDNYVIGYDADNNEIAGSIESIDEEANTCIINDVECNIDTCELEESNLFPAWGYLWTVDDYTDTVIRDNLRAVGEMGIIAYEYEPTGTLYIGINGAGYDFYEAHWSKLYDFMELKWHNN